MMKKVRYVRTFELFVLALLFLACMGGVSAMSGVLTSTPDLPHRFLQYLASPIHP